TFGSGSVGGNAINATTSNCTSVSNNGYPFAITNNSIIATTTAQLDAQASGSVNCNNTTGLPTVVYNFTAQKNYLSSPSNKYNSKPNTISPTVTGNFCAGGSAFSQTDSTQCATTGFVTPPTCSFTLGLLNVDPVQQARVVPFATTNFTAQYGAVEWLASTSST